MSGENIDRSKDEEVILNTDPRAATFKTVTGWVSRHGRFYGNDGSSERVARYDGSTHTQCECGAVTSKSYTHCDTCRERLRHERWLELPLVEWDGETPLVTDHSDQYFFDAESIYDYCEENEVSVGDLDLVLCVENRVRQLDTDYFCDELPEDGDLPDELEEAVKAFNDVVRKMKPLSWSPGRKRVILPEQEHAE